MKFSLLLLISLGIISCGVLRPVKDAAAYHLLDPLVPARTLSSATPAIAIQRPALPGYLDRQQWVTRSGGQLMMSSVELWGEPLDMGISRVTASNLSHLTGSMNIQPVENFTTLDYTSLLEIRITRFEPDEAKQLILEGTWKLQPVNSTAARSHYFSLKIPLTNPSASARMAGMNTALEMLARQISHEFPN
ncbi:MAG: membrane integrity-associated transporter subunit PqiC [Gloeobacteraceae cyanobacterium ES-bin-144]|nr:membrane integrity-associated transporter subunit PqiC [Verrucomicrobiales bacterium]